jgi:hypothetical protein
MEIKIIILCELSKTQKDKYHVFSHMWNPKKIHENRRGTIREEWDQQKSERGLSLWIMRSSYNLCTLHTYMKISK